MDAIKRNYTNSNTHNFVVEKVEWERVQLLIHGHFNQKADTFALENIENNEIYKVDNYVLDDNTFYCRINVAKLNERFIKPGKYRLVHITSDRKRYATYKVNKDTITNINKKIFYDNNDEKKSSYIIDIYFDEKSNHVIFEIVFKNVVKNNNIFNFNNVYKSFFFNIRDVIFKLIFLISRWIFKNKEDTILFTSESRQDLSGNLEFIYDEMIHQKLDMKYKIYRLFKPSITDRYKLIDKFKLPYLLGKSKYIILDDYHPSLNKLQFRKNQEIIQVWHAVGAFKTFGFSRFGKKGGPFLNRGAHNKYSKVYVSSENVIPYYAEAFGINEKKVIATGIPRTDIFFKANKDKIKMELTAKFPIILDKKVILFAPTFRGNGHKNAYYPLDKVDFESLATYCRKNNSVVLFKMHPFISEKICFSSEYKDIFLDISNIREANKILYASDILISDYSSIMYEFSVFKKPMIFYAFDLDEYEITRGFYEEYKKFVPGKIVSTFDQIIQTLYDEDFQIERIEKFYKAFFKFEDGNSSMRVVKDILEDKGSLYNEKNISP